MEPSLQTLAGDAPLHVLKRYFLAVRPMFLTASVLPVLVGSSWGAIHAGEWQWGVMFLAIVNVALVHASVNVLNDVYDELNGTDRLNQSRVFPFTGGSRFIQNGVLTVNQMKRYALLLLVVATMLGMILVLLKGPAILLFGLFGVALGFLYSAPPVALASRGLGELAVALGFGVLPVLGAVWLQTGTLDLSALLLSIPISCWVANILIMNEIPDAQADARSGKATLAVRFGLATLRGLFRVLALLSVVAAAMLAMSPEISNWGMIPLLLLFLLALRATGYITSHEPDQKQLKPAIQQTLTIHALGCIWLVVWPWL